MSCTVPLSAWPMWSSPVTSGGGKQMVYRGLSLFVDAVNRPAFSQRAYQPASMAFGSNAFGISLWTCFITCSGSGAPARRSRLARLSRRGYGYALGQAHERNLSAAPPPRSPSEFTRVECNLQIGRECMHRRIRTGLGGFADHPGRALRLLAQLELRLQCLANRALGDQAPLDIRTRWDLEHRVQQSLLDDRLERAGAGAAQQRQLGDGVEASFLEDELDVVQREELLILLDERVLRLGEDADDVLLVEVVQRDDDGQTADELGNEPVLQQVLRLQLLQRLGDRLPLNLGVG